MDDEYGPEELTIQIKKVREIMTGDVETISTEAYVIEAIKRMFDKKIGSVVVAEGEKVIGILSERDLVNKLYIRGDNPVNVKVTDIMASDPVSISPDKTVLEATTLMQEGGFRRLPVVDKGRLVGFVTQSDLLKALVSGISRY
ncbi:MAG: CBS domain-containing protein [Candidatus Hydrothermarchaeales archaeon]